MSLAPEFPPPLSTLRPTVASERPRTHSTSFRALAGGRTPLDGSQASAYLAHAYQSVTGSPPSPATLGLLWAQWALETARGQAMYGNNFGGVKARGTAPGANFATHEGFGAAKRRIVDRFRTYATPEEGARDYVGLLARRFPDAFEAAQRGDIQGFASALARRGYFTANPETYRKGLERLAAEHASGVVQPGPSAQALVPLLAEGVRRSLERKLDRDG